MNNEFEKYWADQLKSCGATCERERILPPYQEVFEAGAAMRERCVEVAEPESNCQCSTCSDLRDIAASIRKIEVE